MISEGNGKTGTWLQCEHSTREVRRRRFSNGVVHYVHQCLTCGNQVGNALPKLLVLREGKTPPDWNDQLAEEWSQRCRQHFAAVQEERLAADEETLKFYNEYIKTPEWREK